MMNISADDLQKGILGLLFFIITGLFGWRGINKVRADNARENRDSRFEENVQKRLDAALERNDRLSAELIEAKEGKALMQRQLREQIRRTHNLLEMLDPNERKAIERWVQESSFAPFDSGGSRKRP